MAITESGGSMSIRADTHDTAVESFPSFLRIRFGYATDTLDTAAIHTLIG
jgi:hypothetical protein